MTTLLKDQFGHLTYDAAKKFIRLDWFPATADMTADDSSTLSRLLPMRCSLTPSKVFSWTRATCAPTLR